MTAVTRWGRTTAGATLPGPTDRPSTSDDPATILGDDRVRNQTIISSLHLTYNATTRTVNLDPTPTCVDHNYFQCA